MELDKGYGHDDIGNIRNHYCKIRVQPLKPSYTIAFAIVVFVLRHLRRGFYEDALAREVPLIIPIIQHPIVVRELLLLCLTLNCKQTLHE